MSPAEAAVKDIYFNALTHLNLMLAACHNEEQRNEIRRQFETAKHNWHATQNKAFQNDDPALMQLVVQANAAADVLKKIDTQLGTISAVTAAITQGAAYGVQIVAKILTV